MAFTTHCSLNALNRLLHLACVLLFTAAVGVAHAGSIEPQRAQLTSTDEGIALSAEFAIDLGPRLEEAISRGVPLYFALEFELTRARWWWSSENIASRTLSYRISYAALTRQYRLTTGTLHRNFATLAEALRAISRITNLTVAEKGTLKTGEPYNAAVRLILDRSQLPKPFQLDAIANRDWQVDSRVQRWTFTP